MLHVGSIDIGHGSDLWGGVAARDGGLLDTQKLHVDMHVQQHLRSALSRPIYQGLSRGSATHTCRQYLLGMGMWHLL